MRAGGQPFRDVFSSQGPCSSPCSGPRDLLGPSHRQRPTRARRCWRRCCSSAPPTPPARAITDRAGAVIAAGLVSVTRHEPVDHRADRGRRRRARVRHAHGRPGACAGATRSPSGAPCGSASASAPRSRSRRCSPRRSCRSRSCSSPAGGSARSWPGRPRPIAFHLVLWLPWGPGNVWAQSYAYHLDVATDRTPGDNARKVLSTLGDRDLLLVVAVVLMVVALILGRRAIDRPARSARLTSPDTLLARLARRHRRSCSSPSTRCGAPTCPSSSPARPARRPAPPARPGRSCVALRGRPPLPRGARLADAPPDGLHRQRRAGRRAAPRRCRRAPSRSATTRASCGGPGGAPPPTSSTRPSCGSRPATSPSASLAAVAAQADVCAVVVRSAVRWGSFDDLPDRLAAVGYEVADEDDLGRRLYLKPPTRLRPRDLPDVRSRGCEAPRTGGDRRRWHVAVGGGGRGGRGGAGRGSGR